MTRRIALTILASVWAMLIFGGLGAYFTVRAVLLADLDASLRMRALALLSADGGAGRVPGDDRFRIQDELGRTVGRPTTVPGASPTAVQVLNVGFASEPDGRGRRRT